ncbi:adhesion G protein-coupled receptor G3-like [Poecilia latipinna]|uniref:adhesion G protein-coupled receptor G3-like n=1 Tax=Poecilia latipinna TaxID=48699 RepID=UPI00072EDF29|nr:PREDICTED: adhesion G protein-coupled receptor G3-like [Poecilia latipinna]
MALAQNENYIRILIFPGVFKNDNDSSVLHGEVLGIEMGSKISNLSKPIDIQYNNATLVKSGLTPKCVSWDNNKRNGNEPNWTTDGCTTIKNSDNVKCQCSHLTFFGILLSSVPLIEDGKPEKLLTFEAPKTPLDSDQAAKLMKNLSFILDLMGNSSSAAIKMGNITGVMSRLPKQNQTVMDFGFQSSGDVMILKENNNGVTNIKQTIHFPKKASKSAVEQNGSFAGVFLFPEIEKLNKTSSFFNNEMMGVEMGVSISNLSETIDIHFTDVNTTEFNATCVSWDGTSKEEGGKNKWITDGCLTNEANGSITCQCSHLTFFAILMSTDVQISSSDLKTLTQITKAGCGISLFFLGVALFMHFLIRKTKASESVKILMNLFVALFFLNLCFLVNESIAKLKVSAACVAMAAALHYSMLATFTWFFMQALHLYFNLHQISTGIKYYMGKICITGWVVPAVVVVGLLASSKYDYIDISDNNGTSVTMCWIPDYATHLVVNISYYGIVFIFTLTIFVVTVVQIKHFTPKEAKTQESTKKRVFSLLGLFCLLGITWGFAFFSYGPLLLPSYYIFTVLNSFQGFFLFVYYYFSSRILPEVSKQTKSSNQTSETVSKSPYG